MLSTFQRKAMHVKAFGQHKFALMEKQIRHRGAWVGGAGKAVGLGGETSITTVLKQSDP